MDGKIKHDKMTGDKMGSKTSKMDNTNGKGKMDEPKN